MLPIDFHTDGLSRIVDNQHLLDATEIFRKLNVHKKVCISRYFMTPTEEADMPGIVGIILQARIPFGHVLLLSILDDR
jgi:hypothetical protein